MPSDTPKIMELLDSQDSQMQRLTDLAAQQAVVVKAIKARQDRRGTMISNLEKEVAKMKATEKKSLNEEAEAKKPSPKAVLKLGPRK